MDFGFIPVAEASVQTLMKSINKVIINPIIFFLFALALVYFLYGVAQYLLNPSSEDVRKTSKTHMLYGVIGLFIMVAVFGIENLLLKTVGEKKIKIENTGDYSIVDNGQSSTFDTYNSTDPYQVDVTTGGQIDLRSAKNVDLTTTPGAKVSDFNKNPFGVTYYESPFCWHKELHATGSTEYNALQAASILGKNTYLTDNIAGDKDLPVTFGRLTAYDPTNKTYHVWVDVRAPTNGGDKNDCVLAVKSTEELPLDKYVTDSSSFSTSQSISTGPSPLTYIYSSDDLFYRVRGIGVSPLLEIARDMAIKKAFQLLGIELQINNMTTVYPTGRILEEKYLTRPDGNYEYWVAVESSKSVSGSSTTYPVTKTPPFSNSYDSNTYFIKATNYGLSKDSTEARAMAVSKDLIELSEELKSLGISPSLELSILLEEKQIINKDTGEYEYWVAMESSRSVDGAKIASESAREAPFTKVYGTDESAYRIIASGVDKDLSIANEIALNNGVIKLKDQLVKDGVTSPLNQATILDKSYSLNSLTNNYEYWVVLELKK